MPRVILLLFLVHLGCAQQFWKDAVIKTPYGFMKLSNMYLSRNAEERTCEFTAELENTTGVAWEKAEISIIAADDFEFVRVFIGKQSIAGDGRKLLTGACNYDVRIIPSSVTAFLTGEPNKDDVAAYQRSHQARH